LIDDVFTTCSTVQECAKVLKAAGAKEVVSFSIARG
ncbi:amidophosphoribosyltransferase, partial [Candidatus Parcubacteria bacterium]